MTVEEVCDEPDINSFKFPPKACLTVLKTTLSQNEEV